MDVLRVDSRELQATFNYNKNNHQNLVYVWDHILNALYPSNSSEKLNDQLNLIFLLACPVSNFHMNRRSYVFEPHVHHIDLNFNFKAPCLCTMWGPWASTASRSNTWKTGSILFNIFAKSYWCINNKGIRFIKHTNVGKSLNKSFLALNWIVLN